MNIRRWTVALAVTVAAGVAGCGSDDSDSSGSAAGSGNAPAGDPIRIGTIGSYSGAQSAALAKVKDAADAWAKSVNDKGGINGHPVELTIEDDAGNPAQALKAAKKLVEQDKVIAIVGQMSLVDDAFQKYVGEKGIPVVGGSPQQASFFTDPNFYPSGGNTPAAYVGSVGQAKQAGNATFGTLYCAESPVCAQLGPLTEAAAAVVGGVETSSGKVSATAPNYTAPCLAMKDAGVDALTVAHNATVVVRVLESCDQQGYEPAIFSSTNTAGPEFLASESLEGATLTAPNAIFTDDSQPAVKEFLDALDEYAPGLRDSPQFTPPTINPWIGGKLFEAAATAAKIGPTSTAEDVKKGLYSLKDETLGGLAPPLTFTEGKPTFVSCWFATKIEGGKFVPQDGNKPQCMEPAQVQALTTALQG
jgi:branched-chain amino acid transport system substrate-binding protein